VLAQIGMIARVRGAGIVVDQQPEPGSPIERGATATITLERRFSTNSSDSPTPDPAR
jgi:beta-lactam-binding protein with PASTA domain